ncbi:MAG: tetratricopeptide repeat protein, partial [Vicinamibacteria bacterium]
MSFRFLTRNFLGSLGLCLLVVSACSTEARKARHLERGDDYFAQGAYAEAVIEYRNVLQLEEVNAHAIERIGLSHFEQGELGQAFPFLLKAKELSPENLDVRAKLGSIYLMGGRLEEARQEATEILERDPANLDALVLASDTAREEEDVNAVFQDLENVRDRFDSQAMYHLALGSLYLKKRDMENGEREFTTAAEREPGSVIAHQALASLYLAKREIDKAEAELKTAAGLEDAGPQVAIRLADFYVLTGKNEEATQVLNDIVRDSPDFVPARHRLATMAMEAGNLEESQRIVDEILAKNELDPIGLAIRGRLRMERRETNLAIQDFQKILELQPRHARVRLMLAQAQIQAGNMEQAKSELREAVTIAPNFAEAVFLLSRVNIETAAPDPAIEDLN